MKYVEIIVDLGSAETVSALAEKHEVADFRLGVVGEDGMQPMRMLVSDDKIQSVLDSLQRLLGTRPLARVVVLPVRLHSPNHRKRNVKKKMRRAKHEKPSMTSWKKIRVWI